MDIDNAVALETAVWDALVAGDGTADAELLSGNFLGVYETGFATRDEHAAQLAGGPSIGEYTIEKPQIRELAAGVVLLSYRADYRRIADGVVGGPESMYVSSIWSMTGERWRNVFSQDTPAS